MSTALIVGLAAVVVVPVLVIALALCRVAGVWERIEEERDE
jgi:hypothetical protein